MCIFFCLIYYSLKFSAIDTTTVQNYTKVILTMYKLFFFLVAIETITFFSVPFVYIIQCEYTPRIFTVLGLSNQKRYNLNVYY